jgi:hypothetical protein
MKWSRTTTMATSFLLTTTRKMTMTYLQHPWQGQTPRVQHTQTARWVRKKQYPKHWVQGLFAFPFPTKSYSIRFPLQAVRMQWTSAHGSCWLPFCCTHYTQCFRRTMQPLEQTALVRKRKRKRKWTNGFLERKSRFTWQQAGTSRLKILISADG